MKSEIYMELPAIKGIQAGRPYYTVMCPLHMVAKMFTYTDNTLPPEMREQRVLNKQRIPEIRDYIVNNRDTYVFSALTASVDGELLFIPSTAGSASGHLKIAINSHIIINDGQHRRAAIEAALEKCPDLRYEDISIVIYYDLGLNRSQQMFSDLNRYAIRPTMSLNILYDNRDSFSVQIKECITQIAMFNGSVENEKTSLSNRSKELFTLSGIHYASKLVLGKKMLVDEDAHAILVDFWNAVADNMEIWQQVKSLVITPEEFRLRYICAHAITLKAIGTIGSLLVCNVQDHAEWPNKLRFLNHIDWSKDNPSLDGRVILNGRISASMASLQSFSDYLMEQSDWDFEV